MRTNLFNEKTISKNIVRIEPDSKQIMASKKWIELLEKQIDDVIYKLYGITKAEQEIIEKL